jgi:tRNA(Ile)-lysidine synthase
MRGINQPNWTDWHAQLHQTLKTQRLLPPASRILIAVSGGQDSLCLLNLLVDLQPKWQWSLGVVHCNHRWRDDADANAAHVETIAQSAHLPIWVETATMPPTGEAAARHWRYDCLTQRAVQQGFDIVVTGHTQSDRAETLLYNLIRGSGADGLQALNWRRSLLSPGQPVQLVRPLLNFSRSQTGEFCRVHGLSIWEDGTNADLTYARNRIRHEVLPYLNQHFNPQTERHLAQTAALLSADVAYLEAQADALYQRAIDPAQPQDLNRLRLQSQPLALQRRVIRRWWQTHLDHALNFDQIAAIVSLIDAPNRSQTSTFPGGTIVRVVHPHLQMIASMA